MVRSGRRLADKVVIVIVTKNDALELVVEIHGSYDAFCVLQDGEKGPPVRVELRYAL